MDKEIETALTDSLDRVAEAIASLGIGPTVGPGAHPGPIEAISMEIHDGFVKLSESTENSGNAVSSGLESVAAAISDLADAVRESSGSSS